MHFAHLRVKKGPTMSEIENAFIFAEIISDVLLSSGGVQNWALEGEPNAQNLRTKFKRRTQKWHKWSSDKRPLLRDQGSDRLTAVKSWPDQSCQSQQTIN